MKNPLLLLAAVVSGLVTCGDLLPWADPALNAQRGAVVVRSRLTWFDRAGKPLGVIGDLADYGNLELSPDGKQVAVAVLDTTQKTHDLWLYDVTGDGRTRFTSNPADENWLIWSSDGRRVIFNSGRRGGLDLFQSPSSGTAADDVLLADGIAKWPLSWSRDGRFVLYVTSDRRTGNDIWVLPLFGDRKPYPLLQTEVNENWAAFSPDGKWIAYSSTESGDTEVYVMPFPASGRKWLVSERGGFQARWRRDGKELFYMTPDKMLVAAPVDAKGADFEVGAPKALFETRLPYPPYHAFDVTADGQRFLVNMLVLGSGRPASIAAR